jgi:hypothetical protein
MIAVARARTSAIRTIEAPAPSQAALADDLPTTTWDDKETEIDPPHKHERFARGTPDPWRNEQTVPAKVLRTKVPRPKR